MRLVAKIGTSSLTDDRGVIDASVIVGLCAQLAALRHAGHEVVLVTSGAVAAGVATVGLPARPTDTGLLQALAAAGQSRLMEHYNRALDAHGLVAAQVLLVPNDFVDRRQYLHARGTLTRLLDLGCIPIVNENDAIASHEIRFGDNDRIAALVAHNVNAELLVLLTDTPGLYTADPRLDPTAQLIDEVREGDPLLDVNAATPGSTRGSGGMASKLSAARMASWSGVRATIASRIATGRVGGCGRRRRGGDHVPAVLTPAAGAQAVDRLRQPRRGRRARRRRGHARPGGTGPVAPAGRCDRSERGLRRGRCDRRARPIGHDGRRGGWR